MRMLGLLRSRIKGKRWGESPLNQYTKEGNIMEKRQIELMEKIAQEALQALSKGAVSNEKIGNTIWSATNNIKVFIELIEKSQSKGGEKLSKL